MKKLLSLLLACLVLLPLLVSCHGGEGMPAFELPETFDETKQYEITFWAKNDTNKAQTDIYRKAITDFEAIYPNIKVNLRLYTDYGKIYNDVITNISTGTTPDVCITYPDHIATYMTGQNVVVPLNDLMDDPVFGLGGSGVKFDSPKKNEIVPKFLSEGAFGDTYYALPYMRSTEALYINKTYVQALGYEIPEIVTWDFVAEVSAKAMEKDADGNFLINGKKVMIPFIYKSTDNMMITMLKQKDFPYSTENGDILLFGDDTKVILEQIKGWCENDSFSTFKISGYPANFLNAGQCIFAIDSTAGATWMGANAPLLDIAEENIVEFETVVRPIPQYDTENLSMISQGPSLCIFNKPDSGQVMASWLFTQFLLTNDVQIAYSQTEGYVPVTTKAQNSAEYQDYLSRAGEDNDLYYSIKLDATKLLIENTENTFVTPVFNGSASLRTAAGQLVEHTVKAIKRNQDMGDNFYPDLYDKMVSLYRLDSIEGIGPVKVDFGPLPLESAALLGTIGLIWVAMAAAAGYSAFQRKRK